MTSPPIPHDEDDPLASDPDEDDATRDLKRRERLEQNRISARESRKRKKDMIEELQRTVITLSRENKELNERNEALRRDLVEIGTKNPGVVNIQALMSCSGGAAAAAEGGGGATNAVASAGVENTALDESPALLDDGVENNEPHVAAALAAVEPANPQAAQNQQQQQQQAQPALSPQLQQQTQAAGLSVANGFNPQQLAMMQQMMALQQAGMIPGMMGIPTGAAMMGMPGGGAFPVHQQQQQQPPVGQQGGQQQQHPANAEAPK